MRPFGALGSLAALLVVRELSHPGGQGPVLDTLGSLAAPFVVGEPPHPGAKYVQAHVRARVQACVRVMCGCGRMGRATGEVSKSYCFLGM